MANQVNEYPLAKNQFRVRWEDSNKKTVELSCTEVSGLDGTVEIKDYRTGNSPNLAPRRVAIGRTWPDVTIKRGVFKGASDFSEWFNKGPVPDQRKVTITLHGNDLEKPIVIWELEKAVPKAFKSTDLNAGSNDIAMEEITFAHEGLKITFNK
ncbi:MAG: phage tail protein [Lewinellaceae bacterium]|nr:phage tail protein [Lewinellaceae bacterium]